MRLLDHRHAVGAVEDVVRGLKADGEHRPVGFHFIAGAITQGERLVVCRAAGDGELHAGLQGAKPTSDIVDTGGPKAYLV